MKLDALCNYSYYLQPLSETAVFSMSNQLATSPYKFDVFHPIPGLISFAGATERWGLLSQAQNVVRWLALSHAAGRIFLNECLFVSLCAAVFLKIDTSMSKKIDTSNCNHVACTKIVHTYVAKEWMQTPADSL